MTRKANALEVADALQRFVRGVLTAASATFAGLGAILTDLRLLAKQWQGGIVIRQRTLDGFQLLVRPDEEVGRRVYYHAKYEEKETEFIRQNIRPTDVCFDIGANLGYYTLLFATLAREGRVHAFEPVPLNYHLLCASCLSNRFEHVVVNPQAVGEADKEVKFVVAEDTAYSSLLDTARKLPLREMRIPMITVDSYCRRQGVTRADFLKVDVEGAEERVLAGAVQLLSDEYRRPRLIMLELHRPMLEKHGSSIEGILARMATLRYQPFIFHNGGWLRPEGNHRNWGENVFFYAANHLS